MLKVLGIKDIYDTQYLSVAYPIIEAEVSVDGEKPTIKKFGSESLYKIIEDEYGRINSPEAQEIDNEIYAYVPDDLHTKSHQDIKEWIEKEID